MDISKVTLVDLALGNTQPPKRPPKMQRTPVLLAVLPSMKTPQAEGLRNSMLDVFHEWLKLSLIYHDKTRQLMIKAMGRSCQAMQASGAGEQLAIENPNALFNEQLLGWLIVAKIVPRKFVNKITEFAQTMSDKLQAFREEPFRDSRECELEQGNLTTEVNQFLHEEVLAIRERLLPKTNWLANATAFLRQRRERAEKRKAEMSPAQAEVEQVPEIPPPLPKQSSVKIVSFDELLD